MACIKGQAMGADSGGANERVGQEEWRRGEGTQRRGGATAPWVMLLGSRDNHQELSGAEMEGSQKKIIMAWSMVLDGESTEAQLIHSARFAEKS